MKHLRPMMLIFVAITAVLILGKDWMIRKGVDRDVLIIGNMVLFLVSLISFLISSRSLNTTNTHAFIKGVYLSFIAKFFLLVIAAFVYAMVAEQINKPALFICMALYIIYAFLEVTALLRILKQKKNA